MATYQIYYVGAITAPTLTLLNLESDLKNAIKEAERGAKFLDSHYWAIHIYDLDADLPKQMVWSATFVHSTDIIPGDI